MNFGNRWKDISVVKHDLAIVGGGLLGRLLAWRAALSGLGVALYDANDRLGNKAAAWAAGGTVTPQAEAADAEPELVALGRRNLSLWPEWLSALRFHERSIRSPWRQPLRTRQKQGGIFSRSDTGAGSSGGQYSREIGKPFWNEASRLSFEETA